MGGPGQGVFVDLEAGTAIDGFGKRDKLTSIEGVRGTDYDDDLKGNSADNALRGDAGSDSLAGGLGNDTLIGGDDGDFFVFDTALNANSNVDSIEDFNAAEDVIQLSLAIFSELDTTGVLEADNFAVGDATTEDHKILYSSSTGELFYDADGNGGGEKVLFARLGLELDLNAGNFEIV
jgi:Ca2+-binding RTX toxin-like protein